MENKIIKKELLEQAIMLRNEVESMIQELSQNGCADDSQKEKWQSRASELAAKVEELEKQMKQ